MNTDYYSIEKSFCPPVIALMINRKEVNQNTTDETMTTDLEARLFKAKSDMANSAIKAKQLETQILSDLISKNPFFLEAKQVQKTAELLGCTPLDLLKPLVELTKSFARPPVSNYHVSVVGLGQSGNIYLGVNFEFKKVPLNQTVHAEQFLVVNARNHGETELVALALSAPPCGHCRQYLNEISEEGQLKFLTPNNPDMDLSHLLPKSFGPKELGHINGLLKNQPKFEPSRHENPLAAKAVDAAHSSYAPYTKAISGVAIKTTNGDIYSGGHLENAAYNPSLSPLQVALVSFIAAKRDYSEICEVVLAENESADISQKDSTKMVLKQIAPHAKFKTVYIDKLSDVQSISTSSIDPLTGCDLKLLKSIADVILTDVYYRKFVPNSVYKFKVHNGENEVYTVLPVSGPELEEYQKKIPQIVKGVKTRVEKELNKTILVENLLQELSNNHSELFPYFFEINS